ncbi:MAG: DNA topology modulation protein [Candidatus Cloacimonetes bacterium]|jgi:adenylate kinase family enzyme|nr:DNA topology modulation protein [Candidatus Cloacimonadota bacterium]MBT4332370.1 DNA topology modulation protein [Candidatus Cloacimonadota bacterium]MBT4576689.1 DNA topology modulation protein [Candidatus Cloacimonadota bacterium]
MKRVIIIGNGGSGKSTFSKKLNKHLNLELIHLDNLFWKQNWEQTPKLEWREIVKEIIQKDNWIIEGNFNSTLELRIERADTIIFFDIPRFICLWNATKRVIKGKYFKVERDDITKGCNEKFDLLFYKWIWNYNKSVRPRYLNLLDSLKSEKRVIIFNNYRAVNRFLEQLNN